MRDIFDRSIFTRDPETWTMADTNAIRIAWQILPAGLRSKAPEGASVNETWHMVADLATQARTWEVADTAEYNAGMQFVSNLLYGEAGGKIEDIVYDDLTVAQVRRIRKMFAQTDWKSYINPGSPYYRKLNNGRLRGESGSDEIRRKIGMMRRFGFLPEPSYRGG